MANATEYFLATRPAYPWSEYPFGPIALATVALVLVGLTLWAYLRHPAATRVRLGIVLALRLLALAAALVTTLRPSIGIQEDPKVPSHIVIGVDLSESMSIKDEFNSQTRIGAVRTILDQCQPIIEELETEQNVKTTFYALGSPEFRDTTDPYDPAAPAVGKKSDYGIYLSRTYEKWQAERFLRAHIIIGDGADNGTQLSGQAEASRWRNLAPIVTFAVGSRSTPTNARDVAITAVSTEPSPVPIKNELTLKLLVNAFGFANAKVPVRVLFDDVQVALEEVVLRNEVGNTVEIKLKAPDTPGEVRVRVEIPIDRVPGDVAPANNVIESYLTVSKEGVRVLLVDRLRPENAGVRRVLQAEKRFDLAEVLRQSDEPGSPKERELFDFDARAYDVIILGNISARQLQAIDPTLMKRLRELVLKKGTGVLFMGGDATFAGTPGSPLNSGWRGSALEDLLPVSLDRFPQLPDDLFRSESKRFQSVPTDAGLDFLMKIAPTRDASRELWDKLNTISPTQPPNRMTAISKLGEPKPGAVVYAVASDSRDLVPAGQSINRLKPPVLLVGQQFDTGNKGRVLAFAGYDTFLWQPLGLRNTPRTRDGIELHAQFWRRLVLWLAHQEEDDGAAYARPDYRRLPINGKQSVRVGLRGSGGTDALEPKFEVKIVPPGQKPEDIPARAVVVDPSGGNKVLFEPPTAGEYTVFVKATGKDASGKPLAAEASSRFLAYAETSDELLRAAADHDYLEKLSKSSGGKAYRLEDLPGYLKELKGQPLDAVKPKPRYIPDWRRNYSQGFLPVWLIVFVSILGVEWALRRIWGMV